ncbi:hypothetical protein B0H14DRAFT_3637127 [Mycena olivaceomarginata]|nr:hypothetical protein B0H14DRAFT_3637127 [Mycena olivaceomarginata]
MSYFGKMQYDLPSVVVAGLTQLFQGPVVLWGNLATAFTSFSKPQGQVHLHGCWYNSAASLSLKASTIRVSTIQTACTVACDIVITVSLIHTLSRKRGSFDATNSMLTTHQCCKPRSSDRALCCSQHDQFLAKPNTFYFFIGLILSGKLYMNSTLATLNTRQYIRNKGQDSGSISAQHRV